MSTQNGKKRKPWPMWGQVLALVVGVMLLFEGVYQANNAYLRYKLAPMFEKAIAKTAAPIEAVFDDRLLPFKCSGHIDFCLSRYLDPRYEEVHINSIYKNTSCEFNDSKYCPITRNFELNSNLIIVKNVGLMNSDIEISTYYLNDYVYYVESRFQSIYPIWRPNLMVWFAHLFIANEYGLIIDVCNQVYIPSFKKEESIRKCK